MGTQDVGLLRGTHDAVVARLVCHGDEPKAAAATRHAVRHYDAVDHIAKGLSREKLCWNEGFSSPRPLLSKEVVPKLALSGLYHISGPSPRPLQSKEETPNLANPGAKN